MTVLPYPRAEARASAPPMPLRLSLILPAYNEAAALPTVLADVFTALDAAMPGGFEVIVVDDGSSDDTAAAARRFPVRLLRHRANRGKGVAVRTGLARARGDAIVVMDADATYPAAAIPRIVELLREHDLVRGNRPRRAEHMPLVNRLGNRLFDLLLSFSHGLDGSDHLSGLYGLRREALLKLRLEAEGFDLEAEIGIKARVRGLRVTSFPIPYHSRLGEKKLNAWRDGAVILGRIVAMLLVYNPLVTFVLPGFVVMTAAAALAGALSLGPIITPFFGLDIHSYIVVTLGALASFQLIVFGVAAALYGVEAGYRPASWLLRLSARPARLGGAGLGLGLALAAFIYLLQLTYRWLADGAGLFHGIQNVVLASTLLVFGLQLVSAALFLSIFAGRLERLPRSPATGVDPADDVLDE